MNLKHYSGDNSREFWELIKDAYDEQGTLYGLGCQLQNLEEKLLELIKNRITERARILTGEIK